MEAIFAVVALALLASLLFATHKEAPRRVNARGMTHQEMTDEHHQQ